MRFQLGEMFCGPGGISLGARLASADHDGPSGIRHAWALDYHPDTVRTYRKNFPETPEDAVFQADVRNFDLDLIPPHNAFAFGFPCNDFSTIGEHRGLEGAYGGLYTYGLSVIAKHQPDWFLAENVTGLSQANGGRAFGQILAGLRHPGRHVLKVNPETAAGASAESLNQLEYEITAHRYRFEQYGVPQKRHRILIVGIRKDHADRGVSFRIPKPTTPLPEQWTTAGHALAAIPPHAPNNKRRTLHPRVEARVDMIAPGDNAFNTDFSTRPDLKLNVRGATLSNIYRRLKRDEPSYTVTGSGGGGTHMYHWEDPRALTNRERARLQSFPDDFEFLGTEPSVRRQVGMAVPPEGVKHIIQAILRAFDEAEAPSPGQHETPPVQPNIDAAALIHEAMSAAAADADELPLFESTADVHESALPAPLRDVSPVDDEIRPVPVSESERRDSSGI